MKYVVKYLMAGGLLFIVNLFIFLWHFDFKHFIDEQDVANKLDEMDKFEPPIDF